MFINPLHRLASVLPQRKITRPIVKVMLRCCILAITANLSIAAAQDSPERKQAASPQMDPAQASSPQSAPEPSSQDSQPVSNLVEHSSGKASIYVYRKGRIYGMAVSPLIIVNGSHPVGLHNDSYAVFEVPSGPMDITATDSRHSQKNYGDLPLITPPTGFWTSLPGCKGLDWRRLVSEPPTDIELCYQELVKLRQQCDVKITVDWGSAVRITTIHTPECNYKLIGSYGVFDYLNLAVLSPQRLRQMQFQLVVEAGKSYYLSFDYSGASGGMVSNPVQGSGTLKLVDPATGAKEIHGLHPVKD